MLSTDDVVVVIHLDSTHMLAVCLWHSFALMLRRFEATGATNERDGRLRDEVGWG